MYQSNLESCSSFRLLSIKGVLGSGSYTLIGKADSNFGERTSNNGVNMELAVAIEQLDALDENATLCVRRPWSRSAQCQVVTLDESLTIPVQVKAAGFDYFLEVHVAREVLGVLAGRPATLDEKIRLLIYYAENDAYPDWVYER